MAPFQHSSSTPTDLETLIATAKLLVIGFNGTFAPTEIPKVSSLTKLLNQETGTNYDRDTIAAVVSGKSVGESLALFQKDYGLQGDIGDLYKKQARIFLSIIKEHNVKPNANVLAAIKTAQENDVPLIILSNDNEAVIKELLQHWGCEDIFTTSRKDKPAPAYCLRTKEEPQPSKTPELPKVLQDWSSERLVQAAGVYANDSSGRCRVEDKTSFLFCSFIEKFGIPETHVVVIDDNAETLAVLQAHIGCRGVFVSHELNKKDPAPDTDFILNGKCPRRHNNNTSGQKNSLHTLGLK